ncbi:MAG: hypothetical protein NVSMB32_04200 [Actinomycetota bacterium]
MATPGVVALYDQTLDAMPDTVATLARDPELKQALAARDPAGLKAVLTRELAQRSGRVGFVVVADPAGQVVAALPGQPAYLPGFVVPSPQELLATGTVAAGAPPGAGLMTIRTVVPVSGADPTTTAGTLVAGQYLDNAFTKSLAEATGVDVTIVLGGRALSSSLPAPNGSTAPWPISIPQTASPVRATIGGRGSEALISALQPDVPVATAALVTSTPLVSQAKIGTIIVVILFVLGLAALGAVSLGFAVSRAIARPLRELAHGADAISAGRYDQHIAVRSTDEVGQLARAFNEMAARLSAHVAELRESREVLKRSLTRFGETLRSTHDLDKILQVVLDTSIDAVRASAGLLMVVVGAGAKGGPPASPELKVAALRGVDAAALVIKKGQGLAGSVAALGEAVLAADPHQEGMPTPDPGEPPFATGIWVPIFTKGGVFAVMALLDREDQVPFTPGDLDAVVSLSAQAGVAIDNVVLHEEAQRLAITDGMTGLWNHRYFQLRLEQEMDRSSRFRRPFCLLLYDIDDFKVVNDTRGHLVGNAVLIELARRVRREVRDIDVLARYGGEEFVLILPETDAEGGWSAAEKIRHAIADQPFGKDRAVPVTVSIGLSCFPQDGVDQTSLLRAADVALYQAKARGKNCTIVHQSETGRAS